MLKKEVEVFKKILGSKMTSFTDKTKVYTIFLGKEGYECDCKDFEIRHGSYHITYRDEEKTYEIQGCKHIARHLKDIGMEDVVTRITTRRLFQISP